MLYRSQVYRLCPSLGLRPVSTLPWYFNRTFSSPQLHYFAFNNTIPMAIVTQTFYQQYYQAACGQDTHVRIFSLVFTMLTRFLLVLHLLPWPHLVSTFWS